MQHFLSALPDEITNMQRKTQKVIQFHVTSGFFGQKERHYDKKNYEDIIFAKK